MKPDFSSVLEFPDPAFFGLLENCTLAAPHMIYAKTARAVPELARTPREADEALLTCVASPHLQRMR